jgi:hypothetical protein
MCARYWGSEGSDVYMYNVYVSSISLSAYKGAPSEVCHLLATCSGALLL